AALLTARKTKARARSAEGLIVTDDAFGHANPLGDETRVRVQRDLVPQLRGGGVVVVTGYIAATADGVTTTLGRGGSDYSAAVLGAALDAQEIQIWTDVSGVLTAEPRVVPGARTVGSLSYAEAAGVADLRAQVRHPKNIQA